MTQSLYWDDETDSEDEDGDDKSAAAFMAKGRAASLNEEAKRIFQLQIERDEHDLERLRLERTLKDLDRMMDVHVGGMERELAATKQAAEQLEQEIRELTAPPELVIPPPGPKSLRCVDGQGFMLLSSVIIVSNIVTMCLEMVHKNPEEFYLLDQFFMVFYIGELFMKALLFQEGLLCGKLSVVWWNWLDLAIVVSGILDMYVQPILVHTGIMGKEHSALLTSVSKIMRFARLARLLRILKIVRVFCNSDLSFVAGDNFQLFISAVIGFNCIVMWFETDFPTFPGWVFVEHPLLIIFTFEILVRLRYEGHSFFWHSSNVVWNILDFIIVAGGIIDMWLFPAIGMVKELLGVPVDKHASNMGQVMIMLRMARLLRLLRLVRLIKKIKPLFHLVMGIVQALQGMSWVLLLTAVLLYAFSLLAVRLVGHGLIFGGEAPEDVAEVFPAILPSMFTLFMVMNGNFGYLQPLFDALPGTELIFMLFMVLASWSVLAILTAVVSENMINATEEERTQAEEEEQQARVADSRRTLASIFSSADENIDDKMSKEEFDKMLTKKRTRQRLTEATGMCEEDLRHIFEYLSTPEDGRIDDGANKFIRKEQFINGLQDDQAPVTERDVFRLEQQLNYLEFIVSKGHKEIIERIEKLQRSKSPSPDDTINGDRFKRSI